MKFDRPHVESFYHLRNFDAEHDACRGLACFVARYLDRKCWERACSQPNWINCLGECYAAPACGTQAPDPHLEVACGEGIVLPRLAAGYHGSLEDYKSGGGYTAVAKALRSSPAEIVREIETSQLRGRGGAGFPTGRKWQFIAAEQADRKFVIANADEGDPGAYVDRFLLEKGPHAILEAMLIAGYAVGSSQGYIYLRKEYPAAQQALLRALQDARSASLLGPNVLGSGFSFDIKLAVGEGSYVCGEETSLLNSLEERRPEVRVRPPYPTERGLFDRPTLVNNVETLANIPWIILNGGEAYRWYGFSHSHGTKLVSLNSLFRRPGVYEVEFGIPVRQIVEDLGGGLRTGRLHGLMIGGPLAGIIPPHLLDTPFGFEELNAIGACVGHGGVLAFDEHTSIADLAREVFAFGAFESCGKCTPCRLGTGRIANLLSERADWDMSEFEALVAALRYASLCAMGTGLADFAASVLRYYREELETCLGSTLTAAR
jgi:NADH:ubiquinone oxidoreductase subunit F (NADH-binding)